MVAVVVVVQKCPHVGCPRAMEVNGPVEVVAVVQQVPAAAVHNQHRQTLPETTNR